MIVLPLCSHESLKSVWDFIVILSVVVFCIYVVLSLLLLAKICCKFFHPFFCVFTVYMFKQWLFEDLCGFLLPWLFLVGLSVGVCILL